MAWAPPIRYTSSTPAMDGRAQRGVSILPSAAGGTHSAMLPTPATRAGAAHISTVEG